MEIETLQAMNEGVSRSLLMMIEVVVRLSIFFAIAGFAIYVASIIWLCFEETKQSSPHRMKPAPEPPEPDEYDLLAVLTALDDNLRDSSTNGGLRHESALQRISTE